MGEGSGDSTKTLLVLGGTSSIARPIIEMAILEGYTVYASFRDSKKTWESEHLNWIYLDTGQLESIEGFLSETNIKNVNRVIFLIGSLSGIELIEPDISKFSSYLIEQLINPSYLIIRMFESLNPNSRMLVMSSRAAKESYDFSYSIVKSGIESLVRSLRSRKGSNHISYLRSGLIVNSSMYFEMTEENRIRHTVQSNDKLLSIESATEEIWRIFNTSWNGNEGFYLGREY